MQAALGAIISTQYFTRRTRLSVRVKFCIANDLELHFHGPSAFQYLLGLHGVNAKALSGRCVKDSSTYHFNTNLLYQETY